MGRLDDAAKLKVVELRKAGLSFRKIKAVLELQNIKVSAQAIYLYLREFQGRPAVRGRTRAGEAGSSLAVPQGPAKTEGRPKPWNNAQLQNLLREASHQANRIVALEFGKKTPAGSEASPNSSGPVDAGGGGRPEQCTGGKQEEADIQIVSVTSLAQTAQQRTTVGAQSSSATSLARRRVTPSPTTNPILAARKRLLDKALSHRAKSFAPMGAPLRRYQPGIGEDLRRDMTRDHEKYNFANDNTFTARQSGAASDPRRVVVTQRPALSVRCPQPPPRVGVRPPERTTAHLTSSAPRTPLIRLQAPGGGPGMARRDGSGSPPPPKEASKRGLAAGGGAGGGLQDQVHLLATEVRGLGLAVKMLVEQQSRLEREQTQQTRVQRQILGALQVLASRLGPGQSAPPQPDKTPTPPSVPAASASFGEDAFPYSQGAYVPRSPPQNAYSAMGGLEMVEAFKLPELRGTDINGFPPCSNTEPLSHAYAQTQPYTTAYTQTRGQMTVPCYTQSLAQPYAQGSAPFRGPDAKVSDFPSSCLQVSLQNCNIHTELEMNSTQSSRNDQLNIIKVEDT